MASQRIQLTVEANLALGNLKSSAEQMQRILQEATNKGLSANSTNNFQNKLKALTEQITAFESKTKNGFSNMGDFNKANNSLEKMHFAFSELLNDFQKISQNPLEFLPKETVSQLSRARDAIAQAKGEISEETKQQRLLTLEVQRTEAARKKTKADVDLNKKQMAYNTAIGKSEAHQRDLEAAREAQRQAEAAAMAAEARLEQATAKNTTENQQAYQKQIEDIKKYTDALETAQQKQQELNKKLGPNKDGSGFTAQDLKLDSNKAYQKISEDLINIQNQADEARNKLKLMKNTAAVEGYSSKAAAGKDTTKQKQYDAYTNEKNKLELQITQYENQIKNLKKELTEIEQRVRGKATDKAKRELTEANRSAGQYSSLLNKAQDRGNEDVARQFQQASEEATKYGQAAEQAAQKVQELEAAGKNIKLNLNNATTELDQSKEKANEADEALKKIVTSISELQDKPIDIDTSIANLKTKFSELGIEVTEDCKSIKDFEEILNSLEAGKVAQIKQVLESMGATLDDSSGHIKIVAKEMGTLGSATQEMTDRMKDVQSLKNRISYFLGLNNAINLVRNAIKNAFTSIKELDKAMTETAVVTNFSIGDMWEQLPRYTEMANQLGATTQGAYETLTLFYQQGLNTDQTFAIGTETMKMARIAGLDYAEATNLMTAALRGFNMELNETSATKVNDVYSKLASITAANTQEIASAMTKTASIANSANMDFGTTAAFLSQIIETTRESAETAGTAMKTIIARFSEVKNLYSKGELMGTDEEGQAININKIDAALKKVGISLNEFIMGNKGLDEIFLELASKWDTLDMATQRYIATMAAGSRQQSRFIAMMANYDRTMQLVDAANGSAGASQEQFEKTLESLESKLNALKNAWQEFTMGLADDSFVKSIIDALTNLLNFVNKITDVFGASGGAAKILLFITGFEAAKIVIKGVFDTLENGAPVLENIARRWEELGQKAKIAQNETSEASAGMTASAQQEGSKIPGLIRTASQKMDGGDKSQRLANNASMIAAVTAAISGLLATAAKANAWGETWAESLNDVSTAALGASLVLRALSLLKLANPWTIGITVAIAGLVAFSKIIARINKDKSLEGQLESTKKVTESAKQSAQEAQKAYENLLSLGEKKASLEERLATLTEGTQDWKQALVDVNDQILEILELFPDLKEKITIENGRILLKDEDIQNAAKSQKEAAKKSNWNALYGEASTAELEYQKAIEDRERSFAKFAQEYSIEALALGSRGVSTLQDLENYVTRLEQDYGELAFVYDEHYQSAKDILNAYNKELRPQADQEVEKKKIARDNSFDLLASSITSDLSIDSSIKEIVTSLISDALKTDSQNISSNVEELKKKDAEQLKKEYEKIFGISFSTVQSQFLDSTKALDKDKLAKYIANQQAITSAKEKYAGNDTIEKIQKLFSENGPLKGNIDVVKALLSKTSDWSAIGEILGYGKNGFEDFFTNSDNKEAFQKAFGFDDNSYKEFVFQQKKQFEAYSKQAAEMTANFQTKIWKSGFSVNAENLSLETIAALNDIGSYLERGLGDSGLQAWGENLENLIDTGKLKEAQNLIESINFNNPIQASKKLIEATKNGSQEIKQFAQSILDYNEEALGKGAQFKFFLQSSDFEEMQDDLNDLISTYGKLDSNNIQDLITKNDALQSIMSQVGLGAEGMARILQSLNTGEIQLTDVTNRLVGALSKLGAFDTYFLKLSEGLSELKIEDTEGNIRKSINGIVDDLSTAVGEGRFGSDLVNNSLEALFGDNFKKMAKEKGLEEAAKFYSNAALERFKGNDYFNTWDDLVGGKRFGGVGQAGFGEGSVAAYSEDGYKGKTYTTKEGKKFSIGKKGKDYRLEGYESFDSVEQFTAAISEAYGVSEQVAGAMVANFREYSKDFRSWSEEIEANKGLEELLSSGQVDTSEIENYLNLLGLTKEEAEAVAKALKALNEGQEGSEIVEQLGLSGEDAQKVERAIDTINNADPEGLKDLNVDTLVEGLTEGEEKVKSLLKLLIKLKGDGSTKITNYGDLQGSALYKEAGISLTTNKGYVPSSGTYSFYDNDFSSISQKFAGAKFTEEQRKSASQGYFQDLMDKDIKTVTQQYNGETIEVDIDAGDSLEDISLKIQEQIDQINLTNMANAIGEAVANAMTNIDNPEVSVNVNTEQIDAAKRKLNNLPKTISVTATVGIEADGATLRVIKVAASGGLVGSFAKGGKIGSYAKGTFGAKRRLSPGLSLTGEEGIEIVWNKDKQYSYLVGQNGPEFANLQPGDQVFNNSQTKKIIRNGLDPLGSFAKGTFGSYANTNTNASRPSSGNSPNLRSTSGNPSSGQSSNKKWKNSIDWFYNYIQRTNAALKIREKYEREYNLYLKKAGTTLKQIIENYRKDMKALLFEREEWLVMQERADARIKGLSEGELGKKYREYVAYEKDEETGVYRTVIDWDKIDNINDQKKGEEVAQFLQDLEAAVDHANESLEKLDNIEDQIIELQKRGKKEYLTLEERVFDALQKQKEDLIDQAQKESDALARSASEILEEISKQVEETRRIRDNLKTEEDLAEKQRRLAYLQQDTSNANMLEILKLQKEIEEDTLDYTDTLVDQKLDQLSENSDKAQQQRERQIELMQAALDFDIQTGALWEEVYAIMDAASVFDLNGDFVRESGLVDLLKEAEGFEGLSKLQQMDWMDELTTSVIAGFAWFQEKDNTPENTVDSLSTPDPGQQMTANVNGQEVTGTLYKNGDFVVQDENGVNRTYSGGSFQNGVYTVSGNSTYDQDRNYVENRNMTGQRLTFIDRGGNKITGVVKEDGRVYGENDRSYSGVYQDESAVWRTDEYSTWDTGIHAGVSSTPEGLGWEVGQEVVLEKSKKKNGKDTIGIVQEDGSVYITQSDDKKKIGLTYRQVYKNSNGGVSYEDSFWDPKQHLLKDLIKDPKIAKLVGKKQKIYNSKNKPIGSGIVLPTGEVVINGQVYSDVYKNQDNKWRADGEPVDYKFSNVAQNDIGRGTEEREITKKLQKALSYFVSADVPQTGIFDQATEDALKAFQRMKKIADTGKLDSKTKTAFSKVQFKTGGLADFTGPAWLDGTKSKPEIVLNQQDSKNFMLLKDVLSGFLEGGTTSSTTETNGDNYYEIDIHVDSISNDYDVEQMANKIKRIITQDSMYRNVNAINRSR